MAGEGSIDGGAPEGATNGETGVETGGADARRYGDIHAPSYDALFDGREDVELVARTLHELVADGTDALELGVGTGRLAIPLSARGVRVHGVDHSEPMLERLRAKVGPERVVPVRGDFRTVRVEAPVSLVFCAFSSLFMLPDQDAQVRTVANAAAHLGPGGRLLVECFVHDRTRFVNDQEIVALDVADDSATFRMTVLAPNDQVLRIQKVGLAGGEVRFLPNRLRFVYPSELDLMARLAGLEPEFRWSDWERRAFTARSANLVAVYRKP